MPDPRWRLHKTTKEREQERAHPPSFVDTLSTDAGQRLATRLVSKLRNAGLSTKFTIWRLCEYLILHRGRVDVLPIAENSYGNLGKSIKQGATPEDNAEELLRMHLMGWVAKDSGRVCDFLDFVAQFLVEEANVVPSDYGNSEASREAASRFVRGTVETLNESLQHDAIIFRIVPDSEVVYAVHRLPSEALEKNAIEPALKLLREESIPEALRHYEIALRAFARGGDECRTAIVESSHAVESTMKTILRERLGDSSCDTFVASKLLEQVEAVGILPKKYESIWTHLRGLLQGAPTVRNKEGGHGDAPGAEQPDQAVAEYAVNMAGASIVFLVRRWKLAR